MGPLRRKSSRHLARAEPEKKVEPKTKKTRVSQENLNNLERLLKKLNVDSPGKTRATIPRRRRSRAPGDATSVHSADSAGFPSGSFKIPARDKDADDVVVKRRGRKREVAPTGSSASCPPTKNTTPSGDDDTSVTPTTRPRSTRTKEFVASLQRSDLQSIRPSNVESIPESKKEGPSPSSATNGLWESFRRTLQRTTSGFLLEIPAKEPAYQDDALQGTHGRVPSPRSKRLNLPGDLKWGDESSSTASSANSTQSFYKSPLDTKLYSSSVLRNKKARGSSSVQARVPKRRSLRNSPRRSMSSTAVSLPGNASSSDLNHVISGTETCDAPALVSTPLVRTLDRSLPPVTVSPRRRGRGRSRSHSRSRSGSRSKEPSKKKRAPTQKRGRSRSKHPSHETNAILPEKAPPLISSAKNRRRRRSKSRSGHDSVATEPELCSKLVCEQNLSPLPRKSRAHPCGVRVTPVQQPSDNKQSGRGDGRRSRSVQRRPAKSPMMEAPEKSQRRKSRSSTVGTQHLPSSGTPGVLPKKLAPEMLSLKVAKGKGKVNVNNVKATPRTITEIHPNILTTSQSLRRMSNSSSGTHATAISGIHEAVKWPALELGERSPSSSAAQHKNTSGKEEWAGIDHPLEK